MKALVEFLRNSPLIQLLEYLGRLSVVIAVITFIWEYPERAQRQEYQAWQVIYAAAGGGGAGVSRSVSYLVKRRVPLAQANLSKSFLHGAMLAGADLRVAQLWQATLSASDLQSANLSGAYLAEANLNNSNLTAANLSGADLERTDLAWAVLDDADLTNCSKLTQSQLDAACATKTVKLSPPYTPPKADCSRIRTWRRSWWQW